MEIAAHFQSRFPDALLRYFGQPQSFRPDRTTSPPAKIDLRAKTEHEWAALRRGEIEIRPVAHEQLFVARTQTDEVIEPPLEQTPPAKH
jgi:hypothetical protein